MKLGAGFLSAGLITLMACACGPVPDVRTFYEGDLRPPVFISAESISESSLILTFSEPVHLDPETLILPQELGIPALSGSGEQRQLTFPAPLEAGKEYILEASVEDPAGNSLTFVTPFYGKNEHIPLVLLNEISTRGSATHPDMIELAVLSSGNMAGLTLTTGTAEQWEDRFLFPAVSVEAGDYLLIHCKPQGIPEEKNETLDRASSGGLDASPLAYDFWIPDGQGLSGNNGAISLYDSPGGKLLDCILYSDRTSGSDEKYGGFGSRVNRERAEELFHAGGWSASGDTIRPEDTVDPSDSTSTRSICRDSVHTDTNSREDWHIVPTRQSTFGGINSDEVFSR